MQCFYLFERNGVFWFEVEFLTRKLWYNCIALIQICEPLSPLHCDIFASILTPKVEAVFKLTNFQPTFHFYTSWKTSRYRSGTLAKNELTENRIRR